jgi:NAD dependent epimerase/dehydratase family enzyme
MHLMDSSLSGPVNLVAPNPVTNADFTKTLAKTLGRPALFVIPRSVLAIRFGREMAEGTALANQRVTPARLVADGFGFTHSDLPSALRHVLGR